ncbi:MAG: hypothetical protein KAU16_07060 [Methanophagales archaeon]|nr:hypothetical protein [Methanophagales archaeon]
MGAKTKGVAERPGLYILAGDDESNEYYITLTAKGTDKIEVCCRCDLDELKYTFGASYSPGDAIDIDVSCWSADAHASLTLSTNTENGILSMSSPKTLTKIIISIKEFVKNPTKCGDYIFYITVNDDTDSATVRLVGGNQTLLARANGSMATKYTTQ